VNKEVAYGKTLRCANKVLILSRNTNKMQLCNRIYYSKVFLNVQHVSSGTSLMIRSSKLYLQPLVYMPMW